MWERELGTGWGGPQAKVRAGKRAIDESAESTKPCGHSAANAGGSGGRLGIDLIPTIALQSWNYCHPRFPHENPRPRG